MGNHYESSIFFVIGTSNKVNQRLLPYPAVSTMLYKLFMAILNGIVIVCFIGSLDKGVNIKQFSSVLYMFDY